MIASRCAEIGRDPATLRVSVHLWGIPADVAPGRERRERLRDYADLGCSRAIVQGFAGVRDERILDGIADDCLAIGMLEMPAAAS